ncbi:MAG: mechanosensitive ion channel [Methylovulum sp.]|jgi:potassium efflux system protein|nr:mechanosensitive ion channel [Methylovulum sp.]MCF7997712.1 mechanosensitive ion channel [Methylovulum sp.]
MKLSRHFLFFIKYSFFLGLLILINSNFSQLAYAKNQQKHPSLSAEVTKETLQAKIDAINNRQGFDEATKTKLLKFYQSAQDNLANSDTFNARTSDYKLAIKEAPDKTKRLLNDIEQTQARLAKQKSEEFATLATDELEQRLIIEKEKISNLNEQLKKLENELSLQQARPQLIRQELATAKQELESTQKKLETPPSANEAKLEVEASRIFLKTLLDARSAELKMLDIEAISNPARVEWLKAQFQLLELQKNADTPVQTAIESVLNERRQQEAQDAQDALSQAEKELSGKHQVIQTMTRENIQYSRDLQTVTEKIDRYNEQKNHIDAQAASIEDDFKNADKKISLAGLSPALGRILREQRRNLLTQIQQTLQSETEQNETALTSLEQFKVEDRLKKLADLNTELQLIMNTQVDHHLAEDQRLLIQAELRVLMTNQKDLLNKLYLADTTYLRTLGDFDFARQQMNIQANKFAVYLDQHLLWVRSSAPLDLSFVTDLYYAVQWLLSPLNWLEMLEDSIGGFVQRPFWALLAFTSLTTLLFFQPRIKQHIADISNKVERISTDHFYHTLKAFLFVLLQIAPLPFAFFVEGSFLSHYWQADNFSKAVGVGLQSAATPLIILQFFYRFFAPTGIARKHFQWHKSSTTLLRKQIAWLRFVTVPAVFIINSTGISKVSAHSDSLGRLALMIGMLAMSLFLHRILEPRRGLLQHFIQTHPHGWLSRLRYIWYPAFIMMPLIIIGFAVAGYYLSAVELQQKLIITLRLVFLAMIIHAMVFRWLTLVNRQLAVANAQQKRKAAALSEKHHAALGGEDPILPVDEQLIDIPKINAQTINLLNVFISIALVVGFSIIWKNILPAFSFLDQIELWQHPVITNNQTSFEPITLTNVLLAGLYTFITVVSVRNFSGIMELLVFRRLAIEAGGRYAVNQLATYLLSSIGFIAVANELGGSWSQVQWLVAALSVGLGFGLQEIFANLVSGIILLFERPIRVGDTVTVGEVTGKVSRIQMRATTIMDWDQKELVVPNKTFITNQLVNWTLTDAVTRVVIKFNIASHSDLELAHKVMLTTVQATPMVLSDPEPCVLFMGFGESALTFTIYVYVSELSHRLQVTHNLHIRLVHALREHHIELPYPQRDIHIRSSVLIPSTDVGYGSLPI